MQLFPEFFAEALRRSGLSRSAFATRTRTSVSTVSEVLRGHRKPPLRRMERWAEVLALTDAERMTWRRLVALAHARRDVVEWIETLHVEKAALESELSRLDRFVRRIAAEYGVPYKP